jgi:integrase
VTENQDQAIKRRRRINGEGSVYKRKDGYWVGAFDVSTTSGARKRVVVYGKTLAGVRDKLSKVQQDVRSGIPVPDKVWKLGPYLEYWLENFVKRNRRPASYNLYEMIVRLYLKPGLGSRKLTSLTVPMVQEFLNRRLQKGDSIRKVQVMRTVLSAALTRAVREELIIRNVARLVELPQWQRDTIRPWAADEARAFLSAAKPDPLYVAFVLLISYGLRRGEVLGLRWEDIDFDGGTIHIHQQLQRVRGELFLAPVKTQAGRRGLPLLDVAAEALKLQTERQAAYRIDMGSAWPENRARVHHSHRAAHRTAQLRPLLPAHLRRQQDPAHQGPPRPAHRRFTAKGPGRSRPRRADDPRPHPDQHHVGDLHRHRRASPPRCADPATEPAWREPGLGSWLQIWLQTAHP